MLPVGTATLIDSTDGSTASRHPAGWTPAPAGTYTPKPDPADGDLWDPYDHGYSYNLTAPGLADIVVWVGCKWHRGPTAKGVLVLIHGEYGNAWWSSKDNELELWLQAEFRDKGWDVVQLQYQDAPGSAPGWLGAVLGEQTGLHLLGARIATTLRQIHADFVLGGIHPGVDHLVATGQSAGGSGILLSLYNNGLADVIRVAGITGCTPFGAVDKLVLGPPPYTATPGAMAIIDAAWGFPGDGTGPAQLRDPTWAATWQSGNADAHPGASSDWPTTTVFGLFGANDDSGSGAAGFDLWTRLRAAQPSRAFARAKVRYPAPHQLDTRGLAILRGALRGEPYTLWCQGKNAPGTPTSITLTLGVDGDTGAAGTVAAQKLVLPGARLVVAHTCGTGPPQVNTGGSPGNASLAGWQTLDQWVVGNNASTTTLYTKLADGTEGDAPLVFSTTVGCAHEAAGMILWSDLGPVVLDQAHQEAETAGATSMVFGSHPQVAGTWPLRPTSDAEIAVAFVSTGLSAGGFTPVSQPWERDYEGGRLLVTTRMLDDATSASLALTVNWVTNRSTEGRMYTAKAQLPAPVPSIRRLGGPDWVVAVGSWQSEPERALRAAHSRQLTLRVDDAASFAFAIDGRGADAAAIGVLETDVWVYRDDVLLFRGRIIAAPEAIDANRHLISCTAIDYRGLLSRRYLQTDVVYAHWFQGWLAWDLITRTQSQLGGSLGITYAHIDDGPQRDRTYVAGDNVGERIAELGRVEGGFDWWVDPSRQLHLTTTPRGEDLPVVLDYGGALAEVRREPDVGGFANQVTVTGGDPTVPAQTLDPGVLGDPRGRWEATFSYPSVVEQATLAGKANLLLAQGIQPPVVYGIRLAPGAWQRAPIQIGDRAWLRLVSGLRSEQPVVRVDELTVRVDDSGVESVSASCVAQSDDGGLLRAAGR